MSGESCPLTPRSPGAEISVVERLLAAKRVAVVGMSDDPMRPSNGIGGYLAANGYDVVPVNPNHEMVSGKKCYASLKDVPGKIDLVNVFRRPQFCDEVVRDAIAVGAKGVWLQSGIRNEQARQLAEKAKLDYVEDRCIMVEHMQRRR